MKTTYFCLDCLHLGDKTDCGDDGGDALACPINEEHKVFIVTIDRR